MQPKFLHFLLLEMHRIANTHVCFYSLVGEGRLRVKGECYDLPSRVCLTVSLTSAAGKPTKHSLDLKHCVRRSSSST